MLQRAVFSGTPDLGSIPAARAVIGGQAVLESALDIAGSARERLSADLFLLDWKPLRRTMRERWHDGRIPGTVVLSADGEAERSVLPVIEGAAVRHAAYAAEHVRGAPKWWVHSKALVADNDRALVTTGVFRKGTRKRFDVGIEVGGSHARLLDRLMDAEGRGPTAVRVAATTAARNGILLNDPAAGVQLLTRGIHHAIEQSDDLLVATKWLADLDTTRALSAAHQRGASIDLRVEAIDPVNEYVLRRDGVPFSVTTHPKGMHANVIVANGSDAIVSSAHLSPRALQPAAPGDQWVERTRELGAVTSDPEAVAAIRRAVMALDAVPG